MFITIGTFLFGLFGKKATDKAARLAGIAALVGAAIIAVLIFFAVHDHNVIKNHDARQDAKTNKAVIVADRDAGRKKDVRDQGFTNSQAEIGSAVSNAVAAAPEQAKRPVGPASKAYYDELRRQQAERKKK